jgi:hypothetical protein
VSTQADGSAGQNGLGTYDVMRAAGVLDPPAATAGECGETGFAPTSSAATGAGATVRCR